MFSAFNSPLPPDILVCTSVGSEGIDLHRHCRQVVHFDLSWNPAALEQRTGRVDRIGSKAFRERAASGETDSARLPRLEIGVPYLAGTYDERMFAQLCLRAQTFEVLTGGALATTIPEDDEPSEAEGEIDLPTRELPPKMVDDLRVRLHVWSEGME